MQNETTAKAKRRTRRKARTGELARRSRASTATRGSTWKPERRHPAGSPEVPPEKRGGLETLDGGGCRLFARPGLPPGVLVPVRLSCGDTVKTVRRQVLQQRVGQRVQQQMAGSEVGRSGPDELARDEFEGGP